MRQPDHLARAGERERCDMGDQPNVVNIGGDQINQSGRNNKVTKHTHLPAMTSDELNAIRKTLELVPSLISEIAADEAKQQVSDAAEVLDKQLASPNKRLEQTRGAMRRIQFAATQVGTSMTAQLILQAIGGAF